MFSRQKNSFEKKVILFVLLRNIPGNVYNGKNLLKKSGKSFGRGKKSGKSLGRGLKNRVKVLVG